jgi:hypothetical protein
VYFNLLYCTSLHCTVLYCTALHCTLFYSTVVYSTLVYCTVLHCTVLRCTVLYSTVVYCTLLYFTALYFTLLYCSVLYCALLNCTVLTALGCTVLFSVSFGLHVNSIPLNLTMLVSFCVPCQQYPTESYDVSILQLTMSAASHRGFSFQHPSACHVCSIPLGLLKSVFFFLPCQQLHKGCTLAVCPQ